MDAVAAANLMTADPAAFTAAQNQNENKINDAFFG
jgi:hypothetical protein